ncbi:MAG: DEAD/DEAH box helicase [Planctomycetaceae bacterium]
MATKVKKANQLTLRDRLSRLTFMQACRLLSPDEELGRKLIYAGGRHEFDDIENQVYLGGDLLRVNMPRNDAVVTITTRADGKERLIWNCTECETACEHVGAALSLVLEEKTALGLAAAPPERIPVAELNEEALVQRALAERLDRAQTEKMTVKAVDTDSKSPWTDYLVTSKMTGKTYRVALRGTECGDSYCTCPDFRSNTLGTCKHILHTLKKARKRFPTEAFKKKHRPSETNVYLKYGTELALRLETPGRQSREAAKIIGPIADVDITDVNDLIGRIDRLEGLGEDVVVYPDAEEFIQHKLFQKRITELVAQIRSDPKKHPLRTELLKTELLPYQMDGVAFAVGAGRAILADDMGLGKTIQGVGVAELLAREAGIQRVLVICPTSLKSQWRSEVHRFSERDCQLVVGRADERPAQYESGAFFTICNYEQVLKDIMEIERLPWDLIILDEGQRIKNWEALTTQIVKSLRSRFALVLSGTPLENRLDELYSVVQFIDDRRLGPGFRFFNRYRLVDEKGRVLGYQNLDELREKLKPILLRRTRDSVLKDLPPRITDIIRITPTTEQKELHRAHHRIIASIVGKAYISEMDLMRLRQALLMCRMVADSTFLVDKQPPGYSTKLEQLDELFEQLFVENDHKAVLFSEWTRMLDLIEPLLEKRGVKFVRLEGKVPQKKRQQLVHEFQHNPDCKVFLSTNAGSTGLNLQAADTVINVDLPWNPAVLEQRIARAHRMGQKKPVQVFILVTEKTLEESLLNTLGQKKELASAALDYESDIRSVDLQSGIEQLRSRLEVLLGAVAEADSDESLKREREQEAARLARRKQMADAGGQMLTAAFGFLSQMLPDSEAAPVSEEAARQIREQLVECADVDEDGNRSLKINLPDNEALTQLAEALAKMLSLKK